LPVYATQFECSPLEIYTSLRLSDSLQENISLFFAELKKLKYILEQLHSNTNAIVLLDEILKGTNSDDKHNGCKQLIKKLLQMNCITIMATHDIELTILENEYAGLIENHCFESHLSNNELSFDYKLKKGIAQNRNATFLMQKMGIIDYD
jgi:DNA mismatch repair ATPase MutS